MLTECVGNLKTPAGRKLPTTALRMQCAPCAFRVVARGKMVLKVRRLYFQIFWDLFRAPLYPKKHLASCGFLPFLSF